jgi:hypothetical protein
MIMANPSTHQLAWPAVIRGFRDYIQIKRRIRPWPVIHDMPSLTIVVKVESCTQLDLCKFGSLSTGATRGVHLKLAVSLWNSKAQALILCSCLLFC